MLMMVIGAAISCGCEADTTLQSQVVTLSQRFRAVLMETIRNCPEEKD
jgi:hypothetical protein